jgi:hypothetical protein
LGYFSALVLEDSPHLDIVEASAHPITAPDSRPEILCDTPKLVARGMGLVAKYRARLPQLHPRLAGCVKEEALAESTKPGLLRVRRIQKGVGFGGVILL